MTATVLPQRYSGVRFRSTLEARWAIFFDHAGIGWEYEPEGFIVDGRPYRPDFLLDCGTWAEVKGDPERLDLDLMYAAAAELPGRPEKWAQEWRDGHGLTPKLLILGSIPEIPPTAGDLGWLGLEHYPDWHAPRVGYWGFGAYRHARRPADLGMIWPEAHDRLWNDLVNAALAEDEPARKEIQDDIHSLFESLKNYGDSYFFLIPQPHPGQAQCAEAYATARARRFGRR
jgi:hypothetical protein